MSSNRTSATAEATLVADLQATVGALAPATLSRHQMGRSLHLLSMASVLAVDTQMEPLLQGTVPQWVTAIRRSCHVRHQYRSIRKRNSSFQTQLSRPLQI